MKIPFVDLKAQYVSLKEEIDAAIQAVIQDTAFIEGRYLETFEHNFARYVGVKHCIGVANGTDALFLALKALGLQTGDEVITAVNTYIATAEAITRTGATPVFVDCDAWTYNLDPQKIEQAITAKTKAIIPVHLYGYPADMGMVMTLSSRYGLAVIEDAAQAHGAQYKHRNIGTFGDCACFSFYPSKNLGAYGDAGAIVTNNDQYADYLRMYRNHGGIQKYEHRFPGTNCRLDGLQAAILNVKLPYLDKWNKQREQIAQQYDRALRELATTPYVASDVRHVYHLYVIRVKKRNRVQQLLAKRGIVTGIHYPVPLSFLEAYRSLDYSSSDFPVAQSVKNEILSLPMYAELANDQVQYIIEHVCRIIREQS